MDLNEYQEQQVERGGPGQQPQREQGQGHQRAGQEATGEGDGAYAANAEEQGSEDLDLEADGMDLARSGMQSSDDGGIRHGV